MQPFPHPVSEYFCYPKTFSFVYLLSNSLPVKLQTTSDLLSVLYTCLSWSIHMSRIIYCVFSPVWLPSARRLFLWSSDIVACIRLCSFLLPSSISLRGYITFCLSTRCPWIFGLFPVLPVKNNTTMNICLQVFVHIVFISLGVGHIVNLYLIFKKPPGCFSKVTASILHLHQP